MTSYPAFSCPGHGQPCAVRTVTKAGSKHLGRPFYVCTASPQCKGWFQLADEPVRQPGKRVAVSIGTDVVVSATVCTDGGETQQKVQTTPTALPDANTDADANPAPNPANPVPDPSLNPHQLHVRASSYDEAVVDACRGFAGAHYDPGSKGWRVPMRHRAALESRLAELQRAGTIRTLQTLQAPMQTMQGAPPSPSTSSVAGSKAAASPGAAASSSASALASASASSAAAPPPPSPASPSPASRPPPPPPALLLPPTLEAGLLPHQRVALELEP